MIGSHADWRSDLEASRDLTDQEKQNHVFLLAWYEHWRLGQGLEPVRASAVRFWNEQVITKPRKDWQLERWAVAMRWHRRWLELCAQNGREPRSLGERLHRAVMLAGARRGLALRTRQTYAGWMARYGEWVAGAEEAMDTERGGAWLAELVDKGKVSFATQKQALNALAFFFRDVCRKEEVLFDVRLRRTERRTPVVMSAKEVVALLDKLEPRHRLMAEMQYGAGLRLRELVSLRVQDVDRARGQVVVRGGKGGKDRVTVLPKRVKESLDAIWEICAPFTEKTARKGCRVSHCRRRLPGKCRRRGRDGNGSGSFLPTTCRAIRKRASSDGTMCMPRFTARRSRGLPERQGWKKG
ncbi:tyrosine-type recombinase/integrase [Akkermansiaceae bacterium]|nr:tyrosine-type recombinase/integrase [Akkermansiaceae bacterium]